LQALADDPRFRFLTVGEGQEFSAVQSEAQRLGVLNRNLQMLGRISKADMPKLLAAADIATSLFIALPAMEANSANKFFDGLAAGCCMAINYSGWQADILQETGAGLQLNRDVRVAARQLQALADHPERIAQAKIAARKLAEERFSRDKLAAQLEQVLLRAVANHPS
jgi:Glycosyltransferase